MRLDWRTSAGVIAAAVVAVAYFWQPPAEELRPRAADKDFWVANFQTFNVRSPETA